MQSTAIGNRSLGMGDPALNIRRLIVGGGISLGLAVALQRAFAFITTALVARIGGVAVLGEYSIALSTAGVVGALAGTGAGTVALRHAGQFHRSTKAYRKVLTLIVLITIVAGLSAGALVVAGSNSLAQFVLTNEKLSLTLKVAAVAVVVVVLFEGLNGLLIALQDFRSLILISVVSGALMILTMPYASRFGAGPVLVSYAIALLLGIVVACLSARASLAPLPWDGGVEPTPPRTRDVLLFGNTQQLNTIVIGLASWLVIVLVTRHDPTLHQMGVYVVGSQLRVLVGTAPTLLSQLVLPMLSRVTAWPQQHDRVLGICTFVCAALSLIPAGVILITLPWVLALYGLASYEALVTSSILVATAVVQLSYVPSANALMMQSLRASLLFNFMWSLSLALIAAKLTADLGASGAALAWLFSQLMSQVFVMGLLKRADRLPQGTMITLCLADFAVLSLAGLTLLRLVNKSLAFRLTIIQIVLFIGFLLVFLRVSQRRDYLPSDARSLLLAFKSAPSIFFSSLFPARTVQN